MIKIKLMPDYFCHPLWAMAPSEVGNIDPDVLPISTQLNNDLRSWGECYDRTLNTSNPLESGFASENDELQFRVAGEKLAERLRTELGPEFSVILHLP